MRFELGAMGCVLAGCVAQPAASHPGASPVAAAARTAPTLVSAAIATPATFALRIGVEHLPPEEPAADEPPRCERVGGAPPQPRAVPTTERTGSWRSNPSNLRALATTGDPLARETLRFLDDMVDTDRERVAREVGLPFFDFHAVDPERGPLLRSEVDLQTDHQLWVQEHGQVLLQRPLRRLAKRLLVRDLEVEFEDFHSANEAWTTDETAAPAPSPFGRASLRVHIDDADDPVELGWKYGGLRLGSSRETGRAGFVWALTDSLYAELRTRTDYASPDSGIRLDVGWRQSATTSVHVAIGDDMDFLATSSLYSLFESPMDGSPGLVVYAVHVF